MTPERRKKVRQEGRGGTRPEQNLGDSVEAGHSLRLFWRAKKMIPANGRFYHEQYSKTTERRMCKWQANL